MKSSFFVRKLLVVIILIIVSLFLGQHFLYAADTTPTPTVTPAPADNSAQKQELEQKIQDYQSKISDLQGQAKTLKSQIAIADNQIALAELRIENTKDQIDELNKEISIAQTKIGDLEGNISKTTKALVSRVKAVYEIGQADPAQVFLTSNTISDFITRLNYLKIVQLYDKRTIYAAQQSKVDYAQEKEMFQQKQDEATALQKQLVDFNTQLEADKKTKQDLLDQTNGSEANYQKLLSQAQAQLASLANFATSRVGSGGSSVAHQDLSDSWGKYYNQRDSNWGNNFIGMSSEQIWEVGCLLTSYAMVATHYGQSITPADVAANTDNFALGTAYFKIPGPSAGGHSGQYVTNPDISMLKDKVSSGVPVVAGISANGGPYPQHYSDHWIVLRGVDSNGNFLINDPWYAGAMNVSINDHYAGWTIIEARIYN